MENTLLSLKKDETKGKEKRRQKVQDTIQDFLQVVFKGCIYVCCACQQTWFKAQITGVTQLQAS